MLPFRNFLDRHISNCINKIFFYFKTYSISLGYTCNGYDQKCSRGVNIVVGW